MDGNSSLMSIIHILTTSVFPMGFLLLDVSNLSGAPVYVLMPSEYQSQFRIAYLN